MTSAVGAKANPFSHLLQELPGHPNKKYYSLPALNDSRVASLPYSIRVLLEAAIRTCDEFEVKRADVMNILNWSETSKTPTEVPFKPSRVLLQDFTGVPAAVDLAAMRDAMHRLGGDVQKINPLVPADLVIDHSVQVDFSRNSEALEKNQTIEFVRNRERFAFLKWAAKAFANMLIVPPGSGIVHQVNLEYLARVVFDSNDVLYPDSVVGTDSHTTMIDGLGVVGWGVGGIEAEAVLLGQPISMVLPEVIGFQLTGDLPPGATATDLVLTVTHMLRQRGVVGKFVEFFGEGCRGLTLADRATIANMSPEYGATMGFFPVDEQTVIYLKQSGRDANHIKKIVDYLTAQKLFRLYDGSDDSIKFSGDIMRLDLSTVVPSVSGPKRPHDQVPIANLKDDFLKGLTAKVGFKGFGLAEGLKALSVKFQFKGEEYEMRQGSVVIAAITSCTNTSNPSVMIGSALLAKNAVEKGLGVMPYIKTSLSPGSGVVSKYLENSGLLPYLEKLGFYLAGFGCQTCIGNSGDLDPEVSTVLTSHDLVACAVLSGNRNFEGRVHPLTRANYLASPMLVVAYALAGRVDIDFLTEPIGQGENGPVFLKDIWPAKTEIQSVESQSVVPKLFQDCYAAIAAGGSDSWRQLEVPESRLYNWSPDSTYINNPPYFQSMEKTPDPIRDIEAAYCLLNVGDSITTDHISPAGSISKTSPAALYLMSRQVEPADFNSYGSRRGNDEVMARGTFANVRLINKLVEKPGPMTTFVPTGEVMPVFDAAMKYAAMKKPLVVLAGKDYGCGSSRDWAAKGPNILGVRAVIAESYERIHRSNLVGMGILPLQYLEGENADSLKLTGREQYTIKLNGGDMEVGGVIAVEATGQEGNSLSFKAKSRIDTEVELEYFKNGGILQYVLRKLLE